MTLINKVSTLMLGSFATAVSSGVASYALSTEIKKTDEKVVRSPSTTSGTTSVSGVDVSDWGSGWSHDNSTGLL